MKSWLIKTILPSFGYWFIRVLGKTMQWTIQGGEQVDQWYAEGNRMIIAFWHGQQLMMPLAYRGSGAHILISQHRDGELIWRIVRCFGFEAVRGSSTRGGGVAFRQLVRLARLGNDVVVTPDGPRGPRHVVQRGVIHLAKCTGLPIVPLTFACSKKKSSQVGTNLSCPTLSQEPAFFGESPYGLTDRPMNAV